MLVLGASGGVGLAAVQLAKVFTFFKLENRRIRPFIIPLIKGTSAEIICRAIHGKSFWYEVLLV